MPGANTWYKAWLGSCGFDKSNLVPTSVSVGHSDSRLTSTTSYHHRYRKCKKTEKRLTFCYLNKNQIMKANALNSTLANPTTRRNAKVCKRAVFADVHQPF